MTSEEFRRQSRFYEDLEIGEFAHSGPIKSVAREQSLAFFGSALRTANPVALRFGLFRRVAAKAKTTYEGNDGTSIRKLYGEWAKTPQEESIEVASLVVPIGTEQVRALAESGDPAIIAINALEQIRVANYPDYKITSRFTHGKAREDTTRNELDELYSVYEGLLKSIHGPAFTNTGTLAVAGE